MTSPAHRAEVEKALSMLRAGHADEARELCRRTLEQTPTALGLHFVLGGAELALGNSAEAARHLEHAANEEPNNGEVFHQWGMALSRAGDYPRAIGAFEQALERDISLSKTPEFLVDRYIATQELFSGMDFFAGLAQKHPNSAMALYGLGRLKGEAGLLNESASLLERAMTLAPQTMSIKFWFATVLLGLGHYAGAVDIINACLAMPIGPQQQKECANVGRDAALLSSIRPALRAGALNPQLSALSTTSPRDDWEAGAIDALRRQLVDRAAAPITTVFFHVDARQQHPYLNTDRAVDYKGTLLESCRAAKRANPGIGIIVLTDEHSDLSVLDDMAHCIRLPIPDNQMMYSRARANRALVMSRIISGPVLFLDTDILLNRDFAPIFDGTFDVGLTYRCQPAWTAMPINEGVMLVADAAAPEAARFFGHVLAIYEWLAALPPVNKRYGVDIRNWRGGQLSLGALVDWTVPPARPSDIEIANVRYKLFPCADFNHAVRPGDQNDFLARKWALHFKGAKAKPHMAAYTAYQRAQDASGSQV